MCTLGASNWLMGDSTVLRQGPGHHCLSKSLLSRMRVAVQFENWDFFFFSWQEGWIISVFKPDYIKSISSSSVWSVAPFNVWSESVFWGHFCAVLSPLMVLSLFHLCIYHHPISSPQRCTMHAVKQFPRAQNHCKGFTKETDESWKTCQLNFHFELKYPKGLWIFTFPAFVERLGTIWKLIFIFRRKMKLG